MSKVSLATFQGKASMEAALRKGENTVFWFFED
jgi:hypothetical protein